MTKPLSVVILAAGQGKRMRSDLPKVLQPLAGKALLQHVITTTRQLSPQQITVVYGHGGDQVQAAMRHESLNWALQAEQKGTGHAVAQAMPGIPDDHLVLVLYGDVPLVRAETLQALIALAPQDQLALLTVNLDDPTGYGRILRDAAGRVTAIVEQKDASPSQLAVREGNTGVLALQAKLLRRFLSQLRSDNAQGEYYLTDVIGMAVAEGLTVAPLVAATESEVLGVNDRLQLAQLEAVYRRHCAETAMRAGATLADPARFDQRGTLVLGRDVFIRPAPEGLRVVRKSLWDANLFELIQAYGHVKVRAEPPLHIVHQRNVLTLEEAIARVSRLVGAAIEWTVIQRFLPESDDPQFRKSALASSFLATLELARQGKIALRQESAFAPLYVRAA
jgi:UDP-N-acetylglucosamine diphosphorylase/glucosamine-1-phosphate N-acetyltransferase